MERGIIIVGGGIAGSHAAFYIRSMNSNCPVTIVSEERYPQYEPGGLPYYLGGLIARDGLFSRRIEDYQKSGITLLLGRKVTEIDVHEKCIYTDDGQRLEYDKLVIATGSKQFVPPIKGIDKKGVFACKTLDDADFLASHHGKSAVVIGSGLIGIEVCEGLIRKGYKEIYLVELLDWILPAVFDKEVANLFAEFLKKQGIKILVGEKVVSINGKDFVESVTTDKREIKCDTVVNATGVIPNIELAVKAGVDADKRGGIKVDEKLRTNIEDIFACGDCILAWDAFTGESAAYRLKHNAIEQAYVVARNCLDGEFAYRGSWNFARVHFFDAHAVSLGLTLSSVKKPGRVDLVEKFKADGYYRVLVYEGNIIGFQAIGRPADYAGVILGAMWRKEDANKLISQIDTIKRVNSPYPWNYRMLVKYLQPSAFFKGVSHGSERVDN